MKFRAVSDRSGMSALLRRCAIALLGIALAAAFVLPGVGAAGPSVDLVTEPVLAEIVPDLTLSRVRVEVKDGQGKPIPYVRIGFDLTAPEPGTFISTDFPIVEGTHLVKYDVVAADGVLSFDYLWPIRGKYKLELSASPTAKSPVQFEPVTRDFPVALQENPGDRTNFMVLAAGLAVFGVIAGLVLGRSSRANTEAE